MSNNPLFSDPNINGQIFNLLCSDLSSLASSRLVCKKWEAQIRDIFWKQVCKIKGGIETSSDSNIDWKYRYEQFKYLKDSEYRIFYKNPEYTYDIFGIAPPKLIISKKDDKKVYIKQPNSEEKSIQITEEPIHLDHFLTINATENLVAFIVPNYFVIYDNQQNKEFKFVNSAETICFNEKGCLYLTEKNKIHFGKFPLNKIDQELSIENIKFISKLYNYNHSLVIQGDNTLVVINLENNSSTVLLKEKKYFPPFSAYDNKIAVVVRGILKVWDLSKNALLFENSIGQDNNNNSNSFDADADTAYISKDWLITISATRNRNLNASTSSILKFWNIHTGNLLFQKEYKEGSIKKVHATTERIFAFSENNIVTFDYFPKLPDPLDDPKYLGFKKEISPKKNLYRTRSASPEEVRE